MLPLQTRLVTVQHRMFLDRFKQRTPEEKIAIHNAKQEKINLDMHLADNMIKSIASNKGTFDIDPYYGPQLNRYPRRVNKE